MGTEGNGPLTGVHRQLLHLLGDGGTHSGNHLAATLGISRGGVWKAAHHLEGLGLAVHAIPGLGYRLEAPLELLDEGAIRAVLSPATRDALGPLHLHDVLDSTNTFLMNAARQNAPSGTVCLAEMQTSGRGRLGRRWRSPFAGNIYLSALWHFSNAGELGGLSLAVGAMLVRVLRQAGVVEVGLKWPNDLLWRERKLGGVLVEVTGEMHGRCAVVVGVGLNCHLSAREVSLIDQPAVDLRHILGSAVPSRNRLVAGLLEQLVPLLAGFEEQGFDAYIDEWRRYHVFGGRRACLVLETSSVEGTIAGVTQAGTLLLDCDDGKRREFASGDVRLRALEP